MPTDTRRSTGLKGEEAAARFLARSGYEILDKNVRTRAGEIDLVAKEGKTLVFVEVKTRQTSSRAIRRRRRSTRASRTGSASWRTAISSSKRIRQTPCRFDVVSVIFNDEGAVKAIRHIPNAFSVAPW